MGILIEKGLLTEEKLQAALEAQKSRGGKLSDVLVSLGLVKESDLMILLSKELKIPPIKISRMEIDPQVAKLISEKMAAHYQILPISKMGHTLTVAMADPLNIFAIDELKALTGFQINPVITTVQEIARAIQTYYGAKDGESIEKLLTEAGRPPGEIEAAPAEEEAVAAEDLLKMTQAAPVVRVTDTLLTEAAKRKASDLLIEPLGDKVRIRYRVDGVLQEGEALPKSINQAVVSRIKVMAEMNISERRLPQDGRFKAKLLDREIDFRVSVLPSNLGEKVAIRVLDKSTAVLDVDKLGFESAPLENVKKAAAQPHGMILVCGPTGSGKTTTLYSILKNIDSPTKNIVTVEDPVEYQLAGINQVTIKPDIGLSFASSLRSILRQDPDIIMVGEIRDFDTVDIAIKAALTGHLVLSTLHTTSACGAVVRLINMGVEPFLIASSVLLVAAQRLIRKLCPDCKEPYEVSDAIKKQLHLNKEEKLTFYRAKGCRRCFNTGYRGRVGMIETIPLTDPIKELVLKQAQEYLIRAAVKAEGMTTLRENGLAKVKAGITSLEEVLRVTVGEQE